MSWVTDILVTCSVEECTIPDEFVGKALPAPLQFLNEWLEENEHGTLVRLDGIATGGGKAFQAVVAGGAFNHFPLEEFLEAVFSLDWSAPESVQVFAKAEVESVFTVYSAEEKS